MQKYLYIFILLVFSVTTILPSSFAQAEDFRLPEPGVTVNLSQDYNPPILKGIKIYPDNPLHFDFILDVGAVTNRPNREIASRLIKYFLASITIPENDMWVNLSPYEKNRIVPQAFGQTEMGRDLLAQDYILKQITASLIYPESETGRKFWARVYAQANQKFGTTNIPVNTFNKVWIVPDKAVVYENSKSKTAYVVESRLKVMMQEDYLSLIKHNRRDWPSVGPLPGRKKGVPLRTSDIIRQIVIPELTREVNEGSNFAQLRQVYNSLILAAWYKKKIKDSILAQAYENRNKIKGTEYTQSVITPLPNATPANDVEYIYQRYLQAFKKGTYNYIKEEYDFKTQETVPRKYFSGGVGLTRLDLDKAMNVYEGLPPYSLNAHTFKVTADLGMTSAVKGADFLTEDEKEILRLFSERISRILRGEENRTLFKYEIISLKGVGIESGGLWVTKGIYASQREKFDRFYQIVNHLLKTEDFKVHQLYNELKFGLEKEEIDVHTFYVRALYLQFFPERPKGYWGNELMGPPEQILSLKIPKHLAAKSIVSKTQVFLRAVDIAIPFLTRYHQPVKRPAEVFMIPDGEGRTFGIMRVTDEETGKDIIFIEESLFGQFIVGGDAWLAQLLVYILPVDLPYASRKALEMRYHKETFKSNQAMVSTVKAPSTLINGGIDLNLPESDIKIDGDSQGGIDFNFDHAMIQELRKSTGLTPIIINIQPIADLKAFLS